MSSFDRLIRFTARDGNIYYGEAAASATKQEDFIGQKIRPYMGSPLHSDTTLALAKDEVEIVDVLTPIPETPMIYGVGLNYRKHATEANVRIHNMAWVQFE
jgi:2-keto-4-pentenoate hydratase/2-oxohepta-3-ene-1,7-dioic acid hydratase in catechol pathway